ncbi:MAG: C2 domain-containing protein [Deltaproteobacteria bacterium]|nr:C2 domain-containing protein [Deltaproteobacteria bacterium]
MDGTQRKCLLPCNAETCVGCCRADGTCLTETTDNECGTQGEQCVACPQGKSCADGICVDDFCAETCNGCCTPDGTCIDYETSQGGAFEDPNTATCGRFGELCQDCTAQGMVCDGGGCVTEDCRDTCSGCCNGGVCVEYEDLDDNNCQNRTENDHWTNVALIYAPACTSCLPNFSCQEMTTYYYDENFGKVCYPDVSAVRVYILNGTMPVADEWGRSWDPVGLPDPKVSFCSGDHEGPMSSTIYDTLSPDWNEELINTITDITMMPFGEFNFFDEDSFADDWMFTCSPNLYWDNDNRRNLVNIFINGYIQECIDTELGGIVRYRFEVDY